MHSDQGSQYTSRAFKEFCEEKGIRQSMSKAGCPYDNSPMIFFSVNVTKMLDHYSFMSIAMWRVLKL